MGHPYRKHPATTPLARDPARIEERIVYALMIAIGAIPVGIATEHGFGVEATIGGVMIGLGLAGTIASFLRRS